MLGKYFGFLANGKKAQAENDDDIALAARPALDRIVPIMEAPPRERSNQNVLIETGETGDNPAVVTNMLDIPTHGERTQAVELLNRFLGRQPLLDRSGEILGYEIRIKKAAPPPGAGPAYETARRLRTPSARDPPPHPIARRSRTVSVATGAGTDPH